MLYQKVGCLVNNEFVVAFIRFKVAIELRELKLNNY